MATDLGKVGMVMKGDYDSSNTYEVLDVVSYQQGLYVAKQSVPANTAPTDTTYWQNAINNSRLYTNLGTILDGVSKTFELPGATSEGIYIIAINNSFGIGCVGVLREAGASNAINYISVVPSDYFSIGNASPQAYNKFMVTATGANGDVCVIKIA